MKNWPIALLFLTLANAASAQQGLRYFLDAPAIFLHSPDLTEIDGRAGAGAEFLMNFATHHFTGRVGLGIVETLEPKAEDIQKSLRTSPWVRAEVGAGLYRTNGDRCAKSNSNAWTVMPIGGVIYDFEANEVNGIVGAELAHFYIRDMKRNAEIFLRGAYLLPAERPAADFGFRVFFNLRAFD